MLRKNISTLRDNFAQYHRFVDMVISADKRALFHSVLDTVETTLLTMENPEQPYPAIQTGLESIYRVLNTVSSIPGAQSILKNIRDKLTPIQKEVTDELSGDAKTSPVFLKKVEALFTDQCTIINSPKNDLLTEVLVKIKMLLPALEKGSHCFISYAPSLAEYEEEKSLGSFLKTLHTHLRLAGIHPFLDIVDCGPGANPVAFMNRISSCERVVVITTRSLHHALNSMAGIDIQTQFSLIRKKIQIDTRMGSPNRVTSILISDSKSSVLLPASCPVVNWPEQSYLENLKNLLVWICPSLERNPAYDKIWSDLLPSKKSTLTLKAAPTVTHFKQVVAPPGGPIVTTEAPITNTFLTP